MRLPRNSLQQLWLETGVDVAWLHRAAKATKYQFASAIQHLPTACVVAMVLGVGIGLAIATEPPLTLEVGFAYLLRSFGTYYVWPLTVAALGVFAVVVAVTVNADWLFEHRRRVLLTGVIVAPCLSGVNAGSVDISDPVLLMVFLFLLSILMLEHVTVQFDATVTICLGIIVIFCFASIVAGRITTIISLHTIFTKIILVFIVSNLIRSRDDIAYALHLMIWLGLISAIVAIASQSLFLISGYAFTFDDLDIFQHKNTPFGKMLRATAFLSTTQGLSHLLILCAAFAAAAPISLVKRGLIVAILGLGCLATFSSGGYLSFGAVLVLTPLVTMPGQQILILTIYAGTFVILFTTGLLKMVIDEVLIPLGLQNITERFEFIRRGTRGLESWPLTGNGVNNIGRHLETPIHNAYVQASTDIGAIGGLAFTATVLYLIVAAWLVRRSLSGQDRAWANGLFVAIIGLAIHLLFEPFFNNTITWLMFGLAASSLILAREAALGNSIAR